MATESETTPTPDGLEAYDQEAYRLTLSIDLSATGAIDASMTMMRLCRELAGLVTNPLGGQQLHQVMAGRVLNIVCFNDPTQVAGPIDPAELSKLQDVVAQLQSTPGAAEALAGLFGAAAPPAENGAS